MFVTQQLGDGSYRIVDHNGNIIFHAGSASAPSYQSADAASATVQTSQSGAGSYAPGNVLTLSGGTGTAPTWNVTHTKVVFASVVNGGTGGSDGAVTITGTTGTGTKFQATGTITSGALAGALTVTVPGDYTANPTSLTAEPVTGGSLSGATVSIKMGVLTIALASDGHMITVPANPASTTTNGSGTGAKLTVTWAYQAAAANTAGYMVLPKHTPASATAAGVAGSVCWDASFIYVCVAQDSWKRVAIAAW